MKNNGMLTRRPHATEKVYCGNLTSIVCVWMQLEAAMRTPPCSKLPLLERATTLVLDPSNMFESGTLSESHNSVKNFEEIDAFVIIQTHS